MQAFFSSIAAVGERSCSHISGLLLRPWSPLALMEYPRVFISIRLPASKAPGLNGFLKTPVRPLCHHVEKMLRNWVKGYLLNILGLRLHLPTRLARGSPHPA